MAKKPSWGEFAILALIILFGLVMTGGAVLQATLNSTNLEFIYPKDFSLFYIFAPVSLILGLAVGLILHELGHAVMARALGSHVFSIQLGSGTRIAFFRLLGFPWDLRQFPTWGAVHHGVLSTRFARLKMWIIVLTGPMISLLVAGLSLSLTSFLLQGIQTTIEQPKILACMVGWTVGVLLILPGTILPFRFRMERRRHSTDALQLLTIPFMRSEYIVALVESSRIRKEFGIDVLSADGAFALANRASDNPKALAAAVHILRANQDLRALEVAQKMVNLPSSTPEERIMHLDSLLTVALDLEKISQLPDAARFADELVSLAPENASLIGTRGSVLIDLGRIDEGRAALRKALDHTTAQNDMAYCHLFLALAEKQAGRIEAARDHAQKARAIAPFFATLKRISDLLDTSGENES